MLRPIILCVDDEKSILETLEENILRVLGDDFDVELADNALEALDLIKELEQDKDSELAVVVTDQLMPKMSGDELLIEINKIKPEVPKILLSGQASLQAVQNAINRGGLYRYISKPWQLEDLMLTIKQAAQSYIQKIQLLESHKSNQILKSINQATQELSSEIDFEPLINCFANILYKSTNIERTHMVLYETVFKNQKYFTLRKVSNTAIFQEVLHKIIHIDSFTQRSYNALLSLKKSDIIFGYIYLENAYSKTPIDETELYIIEILASQLAISINHANLYADSQQQKTLLDRKNQNITKSINYAKRIQVALFSHEKLLKTKLPCSFIYYQPKDIVSGDFYWAADMKDRQKGIDKTILVVGDCTGHGVPGAFMTIMGSIFLKEIVIEAKVINPGIIFAQLDKKVSEALRSSDGKYELQGGMDAGIVVFDHINKELLYAGAKRPIYFVNAEGVKQIKGSRSAIGYTRYDKNKTFEVHRMRMQTQGTYYLSSDGYADQFGGYGSKKKKYMIGRFRELIGRIGQLQIDKQKLLLAEEFKNWKGDEEQTDDVLVVGFCA